MHSYKPRKYCNFQEVKLVINQDLFCASLKYKSKVKGTIPNHQTENRGTAAYLVTIDSV